MTARGFLHFLNVIFGGIYAGFLVAVLVIEWTLRGMDGKTYTIVEQAKHAHLNQLAATTIGAALGTGLLLLVGGGRRGGNPSVFMIASMLCLGVALATTLIVNVPINATQMRWDPNAPPVDWMLTRDRWQLAHALRTAFAVFAFAFQTLAAIGSTAAHK